MEYFLRGDVGEIWSIIKAHKYFRKLRTRRRNEKLQLISARPYPSSSISNLQSQSRRLEADSSHAVGHNLTICSSVSDSSLTSTHGFDLHEVLVDAANPLTGNNESWIEVRPDKEPKNKSSAKVIEKSISATGDGDDLSEKTSSPIRQKDDVYENFRVALLEHLSLSIDEIEQHLKAEEDMRLFCMVFTHDYEFDKETLIQLWLARGFIKAKHKNQICHLYFEILLCAGYIIRTGTCFESKKDKYKANLDWLKNDLASIILRDKLEEHVSLVGDDIDETNLKELKYKKNLKALLLLSNFTSSINEIPRSVFFALKFLEVLHLSGACITELPSSIGNLTGLRYLDLSSTLIEELPESICFLSKLQTLKLNHCERLLRLPEATRKLTSLEHLELDVLSQLAIMPKGMGELTKLETLSAFLVHNDDGRSIKELKNLNELKGTFCISGLENVVSPNEAEEAALSEKKFLEELELRWSESHEAWNKSGNNDDDLILQLLQPHSNLKRLKISCYGGIKFPNWINYSSVLNMLTSIILFNCENMEVLPSFGQLPSLKFLSLMEMYSVTEIGSGFTGCDIPVAFPKLEKLEIIGFFQLESWKEAKETDYPRLCKLIIEECPKLIAVPSSLLQLSSLKHLEVLHCCALFSLLEKNLSTLLVTLIIDDCPLVTKEFQKREAKQWLTIKHVQNVWIDQEEIIIVD